MVGIQLLFKEKKDDICSPKDQNSYLLKP